MTFEETTLPPDSFAPTHTYGDPASLPEVLDVLIVGGGPAGTAAAFRCKELGLAALVIDYDDLMKRIRDYSKDKLILPSFGGGDRMCFPKAGPLIAELCFEPIDKDDMCTHWKSLYRRHQVPALVGVELTGIRRTDDGPWDVVTFDHGAGRERGWRAKHVVLALGRGVPRRFDIPGNTDGIAYRLRDPAEHVGAPACVIGGGTSAAEAVIAISNAKAAAGDPTPVCWSYRGHKMPRVSKALAEVFFEAYVGNGNIHYYPHSEPAAVITGDDRADYLAVRVDRRAIPGRPTETVQLEFEKQRCIACIGEDLPTQLLGAIGIERVVGGSGGKERMVTNRYLESRQPNVYLAGDLLSQAYFETDDFDADPASFREVKHRGNVKSALRDGVLIAQVIAQRLAGASEIDITVADDEREERPAPPPAPIPRAPDAEPPAATRSTEDRTEAALVRLLPGGVAGEEYPLATQGVTTIGRTDCDLSFPSDTQLSTPHASIAHDGQEYVVRDDGSATGVFLRLPVARARVVENGDLVRVGRQFLLFQLATGAPAFVHYDADGREVSRHELPERTVVVGRDAPDVVLDAGDRTLSRRQLAITNAGGRVTVKDLKSVNGSYLRVRGAQPIEHGQQIHVGQQVLALMIGDGVVEAIPEPAPAAAIEPGARASEVPAEADGLTVTFQPQGTRVAVQSGQTLCEAAEAAGFPITAECHAGICGSDPIRILEGAENLEPLGDQERETLEEICELEPGPCRLACMLRITGPVVVQLASD